MADIQISCAKCSAVTTVSEFADATHLHCHACKALIEKPGALTAEVCTQRKEDGTAPFSAPPPTQSGLRLAKRKREYTTPDDGADEALKSIVDVPATQGQDVPLELRPEVKPERSSVSHAAIAGALFLALGGGLGYLRYGGCLRPDLLALSAEYSWIVFLTLHSIVVLKAITENMLQGILCLLVPGYSLFYIFAVSDNFYLRAVFGGLLVGIGQDSAIKLNMYASQIASVAHGFIAEGGGDIR